MVRTAILSVCLLWAASVAVAGAQERRRGPRVIQLDEIRIEGRVQKPNAFYILNRSNLGYEVLDLRTSFVREVIRSVQSEPFSVGLTAVTVFVYHLLQGVLGVVVVYIVIARARVLWLLRRVDVHLFSRAVAAAIGDDDTEAALALARGGSPGWVPRVAEEVLCGGDVDLLVSDLTYEATRGLWTVRVLGSVATAMGFLGAVAEIIWLLNGDHGLLGLQAGLPERTAMEGAALAVASGAAVAIFSFSALSALKRAAMALTRDIQRIVIELELTDETLGPMVF